MTPIDEYLANVSEPQKAILQHIRTLVLELYPDATQTIGYGMPVMKYKGKYLIGFSPFKDHLSVFPGASPIEEMKPELADFKMSKGTIQFTIDKQLSDETLKKLIRLSAERIDK
jgi:uncharacterized protein YdhG (YjbR/CyaY superfamily)